MLYLFWQNTIKEYCNGKMEKVCQKTFEYMDANTKWVNQKIDHHCGKKRDKTCNPYWHQVDLLYKQLKGLQDGYAFKARSGQVPQINPRDIFFMNIFGDMFDLSKALSHQHNLNVTFDDLGMGHCSALFKILPGNKDLYASHVSWHFFQYMLRIQKKYTLEYSTDNRPKSLGSQLVPGRTMSFSGYPGLIYSGDDFTLISPSGLTTIETTLECNNPDRWKYIKPEGSLFEGFRSAVANRLAHNGKSWTDLFSKHNSGTYNNQWMVLDYKQFKPGQPINGTKGLLYVLEQMPGYVDSADMTWFLAEEGYWPSYNSAYFPKIFAISGAPELVKKYGNWFTYDQTPRALIFARDHSKVVDMKSMEKLMRYNDYKVDPLSRCEGCSPPYSAINAISARCDLNPKNGTYPFDALAQRSLGSIDMKITNYEMFKKSLFYAVSSPTYDDQPPFQWSKADFRDEVAHNGMPDIWNFKPATHNWHLP